MILTTPASTESLEVRSTAPTVVEPGDTFAVALVITAHRTAELLGVGWEVPEGVLAAGLSTDSAISFDGLPEALEPDVPCELRFHFTTFRDREAFGRIVGEVRFRFSGEDEAVLDWSSCIGVYPRVAASVAEPLSDELRDRLITAVNFDSKNGHAFLLDYRAFFSDFCNVDVPERIAGIISEELGLSEEGLPAQPDRYVAAVLGQVQVYGVEELTLIADHECNASDSRIDFETVRDVPHEFEEDDDV